MPEPVQPREPVSEHLAALLGWAALALDRGGVPPCRTFVAPGARVPWDECCPCPGGREGQLWVRVSSVGASDTFPGGSSPHRCGPLQYAVSLAVGVLRCAHTVDDDGQPPRADLVTLDAAKVQRDAALLRDAIVGGFFPTFDPGDVMLQTWAPLGPSGGCVGGEWTLSVSVSAPRPVDLGEISDPEA